MSYLCCFLFFRSASRRAIWREKNTKIFLGILNRKTIYFRWNKNLFRLEAAVLSNSCDLPVSLWRSVCLSFWRSDFASSSWSSWSSSSPCCWCWRVGSASSAFWWTPSCPCVLPAKKWNAYLTPTLISIT